MVRGAVMADDALYCTQDWMREGLEVALVTFLNGSAFMGHQIALNEQGACSDQLTFEQIEMKCSAEIEYLFKFGEPSRKRIEIDPPHQGAGPCELYIEYVDPHQLKKLNALRRDGKPCIMVTDLNAGRNRHIDADHVSAIHGALGQAIAQVLSRQMAMMIKIEDQDFFIKAY